MLYHESCVLYLSVKAMKLSDFDYYLPKNQIAQYPLHERDAARLLVLHRKSNKVEHRIFRDLLEYLHPGDILVLNNTKVLPVRLYGSRRSAEAKKPSALGGGEVEILLIKELYINHYEALVRGQEEGMVTLKNGISARIFRYNGVAHVSFDCDDIKKYLYNIGVMPLPPYIKRKVEESDVEAYQTVYAEKEGAIAAPTAGLHFTKELLNKIKGKGVKVQTLTLHVGYGTFKPVLTPAIEQHQMDEEFYEIPETVAEAVNNAKAEGRRIIAVGTTVTRALESVCEINGKWEIGNRENVSIIKAGSGRASLFIYPGYKFKIIDALITNFHLPKSTPLMLTSAFTGLEVLKKAYCEAIGKRYRFFSYGDAMFII